MRNCTVVTTFTLLGLTDDPNWQTEIFPFLFLTYLLSITVNLTIILLTLVYSHLKTPMYFFLWSFSFLETSLTSACIPRFLVSIMTMDKTISYKACLTQLFFLIFLGASEFFLLAVMSYDHYVAICRPLHYATIMRSKVFNQLVLSSLLSVLLTISPGYTMILGLEFCDVNIIDHFACDYSPILKLSCTDTWVIELISFLMAIIILLITLALVLVSYANIITVLKIPSAKQRKKAFSTYSSHMIVVSISYGSCIFVYIKPSAEEMVSLNKDVAILITSIAPVLNPFIYTLRNKQVKQALKDIFFKRAFIALK